MIEMRKLKDLVKLMEDHDLSELVIRDKDEEVALKRGASQGAVVAAPAVAGPAPVVPAVAADAGSASDSIDGLVEITSPMVGTFYSAASPDADPFVAVGASVGADTVVCVIEAMKVFNEIKSEASGTIERALVSNGQVVEFGEALFLVRPG